MDYLQSMQSAIDFMEEHLLENITYEDVARYVYMSNYHFHRLFSMLTGFSANEYMRNRRLSMAGQELLLSDKKVIDVALKYGYESPESFSKAFSRFHGVTPLAAKQSGATLTFFDRLVIKIQLEGGMAMEYRIVEKESFKLLAKVESFANEVVSGDGNEIPKFWERCGAEGVFDVLYKNTKVHDTYGVCAPISKESPRFDYGIGMLYEDGEIPEGFRVWNVNAGTWAVFKCIGTDGDCIGEMWDRIFKEFLPGAGYNMLDDTDFELYYEDGEPGVFCEIWIPVEKKRK